jgi:hypothetical protein
MWSGRLQLLLNRNTRTSRHARGVRALLLSGAAAVVFLAWSLPAASFKAGLEPETLAVGDTATLTLVFEGSGQIQLSPLPTLPGVVISGPQQGRSINIVNGQRTESVTVTYFLRPTQAGEFIIPPLTATIGGQEFRNVPLRLKAVQATEGGSAQSLALLRLVVPRDRIYLGETVVLELQLILQGNASNPSEFNMPNFSGEGWSAGQPQHSPARQAQYGSQVVTVYPIRIPVTPLHSGPLTLGPVTSSVVVQLPVAGRRNDPFAGFDFGLFQRTEPRRVPLSLPAHTVEVLPLPTNGVPASFRGAIGRFDLAVSVGPTNVTVGDPITLRVQISGQGNLNVFSLPERLVAGDFKTYPAETKLDTTDEFGLAGMRTVEQIIIPENIKVHEVPAIQFSFFDPGAGTYRTLLHPATPLQVMPAGPAVAPVGMFGQEAAPNQAARQDIVHIKQRLDPPAHERSVGESRLRFALWNGVPLLAWLAVVGWRKRAEALERNPRQRRRRAVKRAVCRGLKDLGDYSQTGQVERFHETVFHLLQEQIGLVLDQPALGITEAVVDEKLARLEVGEATLRDLHELFQACNVARYAPTHDQQELAGLLTKLERVLAELERGST